MKHTTIGLLVAIALISSCSEGAKKPTTVDPPAATKISDIIFKKSNGAIDSFHLQVSGNDNGFGAANSDSFSITITRGSGTAGSLQIASYIISGTAINTSFHGTNTVRVNWYENTSNEQYIASIYNMLSDTSNHILGSFVSDFNNTSPGRIARHDSVITIQNGDTMVCIIQTGTAIGTMPVDPVSLWVMECTDRFSTSSFNAYAPYFLIQTGVNLTKATYYKNRVLVAFDSYTYTTDSQGRVTQKTITDNSGNVNTVSYKYK